MPTVGLRAARGSRRRHPSGSSDGGGGGGGGACTVRVSTSRKRTKKRRVDGRPPLSVAGSAASSAASSVRFLDGAAHAQSRARFVPDSMSEDEAADERAAAVRRRMRAPPALAGPPAERCPPPGATRPLQSWLGPLASAMDALEHLSASAYSTSSRAEDAALVARARLAKRQLEAAAKRQVMVGKWKPLLRARPDCQAFESRSADGGEFRVVARLNLRCSLREVMRVLATDRAGEFHRSMAALFGDLYVYGMRLRSVDCRSLGPGAAAASKKMAQPRRRASFPASLPPLRVAKLSLNAVSLLQRHGLAWRQRSMCFLDLLEEKIDDRAVLRVLRTMDDEDGCEREDGGFGPAADDAGEPSASGSMSSSAAAAGGRPPTPTRRDRRRELHGLAVGYMLQEDPAEQFTRLFFHARVRRDALSPARRVPPAAVQLLRAMAGEACALEAVVQRRRLGLVPPAPRTAAARGAAAYCSGCDAPFSLLRRRHLCWLCGRYACRKCSSEQDVERPVGPVRRQRVCAACVRRVGLCAFAGGPARPTKLAATASSSDSLALEAAAAALGEIPEDDAPPMLEDLAATAVEDIALLHADEPRALGAERAPPPARSRAQSRAALEDVDAWMDDVEPGGTVASEARPPWFSSASASASASTP